MTGFCPLSSCPRLRQVDEDAPGKEWVPKGQTHQVLAVPTPLQSHTKGMSWLGGPGWEPRSPISGSGSPVLGPRNPVSSLAAQPHYVTCGGHPSIVTQAWCSWFQLGNPSSHELLPWDTMFLVAGVHSGWDGYVCSVQRHIGPVAPHTAHPCRGQHGGTHQLAPLGTHSGTYGCWDPGTGLNMS